MKKTPRPPFHDWSKGPDIFENIDDVIYRQMRSAIEDIMRVRETPVLFRDKPRQQLFESISRGMAANKYGIKTVTDAYDWLKRGMKKKNPKALAAYKRIMQSPDPYRLLVVEHAKAGRK